MISEYKYEKALEHIYNDKNWLLYNFELYKQTLNWPDGLPPIGRSNLIKGTFREKFHSTYRSLLYEFDNDKKTLEIMERIDDDNE